jgi:hypothetical protein
MRCHKGSSSPRLAADRTPVRCPPRQASPTTRKVQDMRKYFVVLAAAAAASLLISAVAPAAGSGRVIRFLEVDNESADVFTDADHNNRGSAGDSFVASPVLYAWAKRGGRGARIGYAKIMCTLESENGAFCQGTFFLAGGTIQGESYTRLASRIKVAVTGGTGAYAGARGTFTSRNIRDARDADGNFVSLFADVIRLLP